VEGGGRRGEGDDLHVEDGGEGCRGPGILMLYVRHRQQEPLALGGSGGGAPPWGQGHMLGHSLLWGWGCAPCWEPGDMGGAAPCGAGGRGL